MRGQHMCLVYASVMRRWQQRSCVNLQVEELGVLKLLPRPLHLGLFHAQRAVQRCLRLQPSKLAAARIWGATAAASRLFLQLMRTRSSLGVA